MAQNSSENQIVQNWQGLELARWQGMPPQELSVSCLPQHLIVVHLTPELVQVEEKTDNSRYRGIAQPGDVNIISAGMASSCRWEAPIDYFSLNLSPDLLKRVATQTDGIASETLELRETLQIQDEKVMQIAQWLAQEARSQGAGGQLYVDSLMNVLAVHLLREYSSVKLLPTSGQKLSQKQIAQAIDYLHAHLEEDITLEDLAQVVHLSPSHLRRTFKQTTGLAPHQYLIQLRVHRAEQLLKTGRVSIRDVAMQVGFADQSHLNRHFKRLLGVTPKMVLAG
jgi:AraC family transcriptional regulator